MFKRLFIIVIIGSAFLLGCGDLPVSGNSLARQGIQSYTSGDPEQGIEELTQAIDVGADDYELEELYAILGNAYTELSLPDYEEAISAYEKSLEINPDYYIAWVSLGVAYRNLDDYEQAQFHYDKALEIEPEYAELHSSLGTLAILQDQPEKAIESFEKAIEIDSQLDIAYGNLALALAMVGRFDDADDALQKAAVRGYKQTDEIQRRIDNLRNISE